MSFKVGDILWVVGRERPGVRVYQVVEELTKKTLSGTITTYKVQTPAPPGKAKKVSIDSLDGDIFKSSESAKEEMISRAQSAIIKMIESNQKRINTCCKKESKLENEIFTNNENTIEDSTKKIIVLPDGTKATLKTEIGDVL